MNPEEMEKLEKNARELILAITEKTLKTLKENGLLKEPSSLQKLSFSNPGIRAFLEKFKGPKYDPNRKFRAGDIVEPCQVKGRWQSPAWEGRSGIRFTVVEEEDECGTMWVQDADSIHPKCITFAVFFRLITPVEELGPYCVNLIYDCDDGILIGYEVAHENGVKEAIFYGGKGCIRTLIQAKAAAEAERDRLNAKHRKEKSND